MKGRDDVRKEKGKASLILMEQLIMLLIIMVAAGICLKAFAYANKISHESERKEIAMGHLTEVAETCKAYGGNIYTVCELLGGKRFTEGMKIFYKYDKMEVILELKENSPDNLQKAELMARESTGAVICTWIIAWQREGDI